jgi:Holliday junction resolvase
VSKSQVRKGKRYEREVVSEAEAAGLRAERAYASNGRALGESDAVDVTVEAPGGKTWRAQCKRRKSVAGYLAPPEGADVTVIREDRAESLVVLPLDRFLSLLKRVADPLNKLLSELEESPDLAELLCELDSGDDLNELLENLNGGDDLSELLSELEPAP